MILPSIVKQISIRFTQLTLVPSFFYFLSFLMDGGFLRGINMEGQVEFALRVFMNHSKESTIPVSA